MLCALVGAIYAALTLVAAPISFGPMQLRVSEALCVLPFLLPGSEWGLAVGCLIANIFGGYGPLDMIVGSLATLVAGLLAGRMRHRALVPLPAVFLNAAAVGATLAYSFVGASAAFWGVWGWNALTIGVGEAAACYALGLPLLFAFERIEPLKMHFREKR